MNAAHEAHRIATGHQPAGSRSPSPTALGVYIQVPFCQTKCTYCNFHTGVFARSLYAPYVNAVCRELAEHASLYEKAGLNFIAGSSGHGPAIPESRRHLRDLSRAAPSGERNEASALEAISLAEAIVDTVYVGGGTPSLLEPAALARILDTLRTNFCCELVEVTLEADPETVTAEKAAQWREAGFNRISLGVQSFQDMELQAAGRMHRRNNVFEAVRLLRAAGFRNLSFDLIAGLPHQAAPSWENSLETLLAMRPEHVSIYLLEIDEASRLGREVLSGGQRYSAGALPDDDSMAAFYELACARLGEAGYVHYEISNWALRTSGTLESSGYGGTSPESRAAGRGSRAVWGETKARALATEDDFRSRHNLKYWRREPYLGFGAGAHSFYAGERWANAHDPAAYVAAIAQGRLPIEQHERLTPQQALEEELFLGLRQLEGIDLAQLEMQYNVELAPRLEALCRAGLVEMAGTRVRLVPSRLTVSNEVFVELLG